MPQIKTYPTYTDYKTTRSTEAKEAFLRDNYHRLTDKQLAYKMSLPEHEVRALLRELGLQRQKIAPPVEAKPEAPKPTRYKKQSERDKLECSRSESRIRLMYAAKLAGRPRTTREEDLPRWSITQALETDYETVITALTS